MFAGGKAGHDVQPRRQIGGRHRCLLGLVLSGVAVDRVEEPLGFFESGFESGAMRDEELASLLLVGACE